MAYGTVWLSGLGGLDLSLFKANPLRFVVMGSLFSLLYATGEEIGWRGYLVPALARGMSFGRVALVSGVIWAVWHFPLIAFAGYNAGTPMWFAMTCFVQRGHDIAPAWLLAVGACGLPRSCTPRTTCTSRLLRRRDGGQGADPLADHRVRRRLAITLV